jgi:hypothetical protein
VALAFKRKRPPRKRDDTATRSLMREPFATEETFTMKKSRGGRMTAAKKRAAKRKGGKGPVSKRKSGRNIMKT